MESINGANKTNQGIPLQVVPINVRALACSVLFAQLALAPYIYAEPTGGNIVGGAGNINHSGLTTTITQGSQNLAIDWNSFNLDPNDIVNFHQPNQTSIALNRILDSNPSQIHGRINANGQIILANPNGVFFSETATVNAGGLFAAALNINPEDFMEGRLDFKALENTTGLIINNGELTVINGGTLALLGQKVVNNGLLVANFGTVALAAGSDIKIYFDEGEQLGIQIAPDRLTEILELNDPSVLNTGLIQAHGGRVVLTARQAQAIQSSIYNIDEDRAFSFTDGTIVEKDGVIYLAGPGGDISNMGDVDVSSDGDAGTVIFDARNINHSGSINADSQNGNGGTVQFDATDTTLLIGNSIVSVQSLQNGKGGSVQVLGNHVGLTDNASINASGINGGGDVLVGGDYQGKNPDIKNAEAVYLGENTDISANATENGKGGKIIVWSDNATRAYGGLSATGGEQSGSGGFIETSSHNYVDLRATVDVHAETGDHGEWLIDPSNLTIGNQNNGTPQTGDIFQSTINDSLLNVNTLEAALGVGANITVQTAVIPGICSPQPCVPELDDQLEPTGGNINLNSPLNLEDMPGDGTRSLTLNAHHDININANVSESGGDDYLNLTLNADTNNTGGGDVIIDAGASINLDGGNLIVTGVDFVNNNSITTVNSTNPGDTPGGNVTINVDNLANLGNISTDNASGNLNVTAGSIIGGPLDIAGTTTLSSAGAINLANNNNDFGTVNINNGTAVTIADSNNLTVNINSNSVTSIATNTGGTSNIVDNDLTGTLLAAMTVGGNLNVTANGNITDSGNINVEGNTVLTIPDRSSVTLDSSNNKFTGTLNIMANTLASLTVYDSSAFELQDNINITDALDLRGSSLTTNNITLGNASVLTLTSTNGDISQNNAITNAGPTILSASGGDINFTESNNLSSVQVVNANTATVNNGANDIFLNGVSGTGNLNITATGGITDTGVLNVTNTATFDTGASGITLNNNTHTLNNVQINAAGAVQINENDNINIAGNMASLNVTTGLGGASSSVTNIGDSTLNVSGASSFTLANGGSLNLNNFTGASRNNLQGSVTITNNAGTLDNVRLRNTSSIQLSTLTVNNDLDLNTLADISQTGAFTVTGDTTLQANNITLLQNNDFGLTTLNDGVIVKLNDINGGISVVANNTNASNTIDLTVTATDAVGIEGELFNMNVTTNGDIQSTNALTVANNTTLNAGTVGNVDFQTNAVNLSNVTIVNTNTATINNGTDAIVLNGVSNTENLHVITTGGGITDTGAINVTNIATFDAGINGNITLDNAANDFNTLEITNAQDVIVRDANALTLQDVTARDFTLTAAGDVIQSAGTGVISTGDAVINTGAASTGNITLDNAANDFNTLEITNAQDVIVQDANSLTLRDVTARDFNLTTTGDVIQSAGTGVISTGDAVINTGAANTGDITLDNATNDFNTLEITNAQDVIVRDTNGMRLSGNMQSLNVDAINGNIANIDNDTTGLRVAALTSLTANTGNITLDNAANDFNTLVISNAQDVIVQDANALTLQDVTARDFKLTTTGDVIQSAGTGVISTGDAVINTGAANTGNITLDNATNDFNTLEITNAQDVIVRDANALTLQDVTARDFTLTTAGDVIQSAGVSVISTGDAVINTGAANTGNITLDNAANDFNTLEITNAQDVIVRDTNALTLQDVTARDFTLTTAGDVIQSTEASVILTGDTVINTGAIGTGNITLDNTANDFNTLEISNAQDVSVRDANTLTLRNVKARDFNLTTVGDVIQSAGTHIASTGGADINTGAANVNLSENNLFTNLAISANQATIVNDQALVLNDSTLANSLTLTTNKGDLSIHNITAPNAINLTTANALLDANGNANNLAAQKATLQAANGIGNGTVSDSDINTQLVHLEAHNTTSGDISIKNTDGDITLDNITNGATDTGNFNFESTDDVFINNITLQQNLTENFFNTGTGTVNMFTADGSFLGLGDADINSPDITATNLRLIGVKGTLGTIQRRVVLDISGKVELLMRATLNPIYAPPAPLPEDIQDNSILQFTSGDTLAAVNGVQVTEVETLLDINPAIFTDIRHFVVDADPVKLPRDQRFEGGYTDDEDEAYFRRLEGEEE
ncbi:MAG: filamentous hemagglutinin N-terminal domain-containing protein [Gammaproteobacteria bacterium]|nr:filamentous hemagglutinin N-terminal domain-containing protein [Gammaproteobacteria bacterium]